MLKIRTITSTEIPALKGFAPPDWNSDISAVFSFHFGQPYFHPLVAELDGELVGCSMGLVNGLAGWLGNIIVLPAWRGRGIGLALTRQLVEYFQTRGCTSQVLIATSMGEPVYRKLGFRIVSQYISMKSEVCLPPAGVKGVRPFDQQDSHALLQLDQQVTGEDRRLFLNRLLAEAWIHENNSGVLDGFYLPTLGTGPVLATNDLAGEALLRLKFNQGSQAIVLPEANQVGRRYLEQAGFKEAACMPRMVLGMDLPWLPERVFSRGSGYCG